MTDSFTPVQKQKLLVSVRNLGEAKEALAGGCDWLDIKEPDAGALGRAAKNRQQEIVQFVQTQNEYKKNPVSAALGEFADWNSSDSKDSLSRTVPGINYVKCGLSQLENDVTWADRIARLSKTTYANTNWITVHYADTQRAKSPDIESTIQFAKAIGSRFFLIDTFQKDGSTLLDWLTAAELQAIADRLKESNIQLALAGKLSIADLPKLKEINFQILAVRSAVCENQNRNAHITRKAVEEFRKRMNLIPSVE